MKWILFTGTWKLTNKQVEDDVRAAAREVLERGDGIVTGGATGVDYFAMDEAMELYPDASRLKVIIPTICSRETSSHPELWTKENPTYGHCAIVSVLAQEYFGGDIIRVSLMGTSFQNLKSHFFNVIDGKEIDFTISQFGGQHPYENADREEYSKGKILSHPGTQERFDVLRNRFVELSK